MKMIKLGLLIYFFLGNMVYASVDKYHIVCVLNNGSEVHLKTTKKVKLERDPEEYIRTSLLNAFIWMSGCVAKIKSGITLDPKSKIHSVIARKTKEDKIIDFPIRYKFNGLRNLENLDITFSHLKHKIREDLNNTSRPKIKILGSHLTQEIFKGLKSRPPLPDEIIFAKNKIFIMSKEIYSKSELDIKRYLKAIFFYVDIKNDKIIPRLAYLSNSGGFWRGTNGIDGHGRFLKGKGHHYTQETQLIDEIVFYLKNRAKYEDVLLSIPDNLPILKYFTVRKMKSRKWDLFKKESYSFDDKGLLDFLKLPHFRPTQLGFARDDFQKNIKNMNDQLKSEK